MNKQAYRGGWRAAVGLSLPLVVILAGCASAGELPAATSGAAGVTLDAGLVADAKAEAAKLTQGLDLKGVKIEVIGQNSGTEGAITEASYAPFATATGAKISYTGTADQTITSSRVQAGNPPTVAVIQSGDMYKYAKDGKLVNLSDFMQDELHSNFSSAVIDTATVKGGVYGVYQGFSPFMLWYNPQAYTGPAAGAPLQDFVTWTKDNAAKGTPTWCAGQEAGGSSGFPGAQMIETLFAKKYGPEKLRQWGTGELPWTSPEVKDAFAMYSSLISDKSVAGGIKGALSAPISSGYDGLVKQPAGCQAAIWGSWTAGLINSSAGGVKPGENLDFMPVPAAAPDYAHVEIFQAAITVAFDRSDATKAFMKYLASDAAQRLLASANQWNVADVNVQSSTYSSAVLKKAQDTFFTKGVTLASGPNVLATQSVLSEFWKGTVAYLEDPSQLDSILGRIDAAAHA